MFEKILYYFQSLTLIGVVDIILMILIVFQLFRALRRSIAFNIFIGSLIIYILSVIVSKLEMPIMSEILDRMVSIGLIGLIVVFQPEIRKFLISVGRRSPLGKNGFISRMFQSNSLNKYIVEEEVIEEISQALRYMQSKRLGAILVIARSDKLDFDLSTGASIHGRLTARLLQSIFCKESPLHDGAVLIDKDILIAAGIVLPVSDSAGLPFGVGLRHRSGVGASEISDTLVVILSEETGQLSVAIEGKLHMNLPMEEIKKHMYDAMIS